MTPSRLPMAWLPVALSLVVGCHGPKLSRCDITGRACQEDIYRRVVELRGDGYDPFAGMPPVSVITEDQFREQLLAERSATTGSQTVLDRATEQALLMLHFTSRAGADGSDSSIEDEVKHVYAYYLPAEKSITVISHPDDQDEYALEQAMLTLAHEIVHALQDSQLDLEDQSYRTSDEAYAATAVIEGDARFYEYLFLNEVLELMDRRPVDLLQIIRSELDADFGEIDELGSPLFAARALIYPLGAQYMALAYERGGNAAVRHAYGRAPRRTVGLLIGEDGVQPSVGDGDVCPSPVTTSLPVDSGTMAADQFGALLLYTFLRGWQVEHAVAFATAQAWTGDYIRIQTDGRGSTTAVSWRIELGSAPSATILPALRATGALGVEVGAQSIEITVSDATAPLEWQSSCR